MDERESWPRTEAEARAVQDALRARVDPTDHAPAPGHPGTLVVGLDVAYDDERNLVAAAAVALDGASLDVVGQATAVGRIAFPYVPGLLAFREIPALLDALTKLRGQLGRDPDLLVCDGYGRAHPRLFGLASHLGVLTGLPSMGVAKNPFVFRHAPVGPQRGDSAPLLDLHSYDREAPAAAREPERPETGPLQGEPSADAPADGADTSTSTDAPIGADAPASADSSGTHRTVTRLDDSPGQGRPTGGPGSEPADPRTPDENEGEETAGAENTGENTEEVGRALRTRDGVKPVYVSAGHRISLDNACAHTLHLTPRHRQPESTRRADALCRATLRELQQTPTDA